MRREIDHVTRDSRPRCKADQSGRNIRCAVIDLRHLLERTRKILRRNRTCRRKCESTRRTRRAAVKGIVVRIAIDRNPILDCLVDGIVQAVAAHILVRHRTGIVHIVRRDIEARAVRRDKLVRCGRTRRILHVALWIRIGQRIPVLCRSILERGLTVVFLVDARALHKVQIQRTARDLAVARCRQIPALKVLPVQRVVPNRIAVARYRDIVGDLACVGNICRLRDAVRLRELRAIPADGKLDLGRIRADELARICRECTPRRNRIGARAVIDLRRLAAADLKRVRRDCLAVDRALAVDILGDIVVVRHRTERRSERLVHIRVLNIVRCAVARVRVRGKVRPRETSVVARCRIGGQHAPIGGLQCTRRNAVAREDRIDDGARGIVCDSRDRGSRIRRRAVVGLRHVVHRDLQLARVDRARRRRRRDRRCDRLRCTRTGSRADDIVPRIDDLIVVRVLPRQLCLIRDIFLDDIAERIARDILICIDGCRGIRRLPRRVGKQIESDNRIPSEDVPVAVRMLRHPIIEL